jgi:hypothetical protein
MSTQNTFPTEFNLDDLEINRQYAYQILKDSRKQPVDQLDHGKYTLYELPRAFVVIDHQVQDAPRVVYLMKYDIVFHKYVGRKCAQQLVVWRDATCVAVEGVARKIFVDHLMQNYGAVITDSRQTPDGQRFWNKRIAESMSAGYHVYYVNLMPDRVVIELKTIAEFRAFQQRGGYLGR